MTRNERRLKRRNIQLWLASILILLVFLFCFVLAIKVQAAKAEQTEAHTQEIVPSQNIVVPIGGNVPAQEPEVWEDSENELIEAALLEKGNRIDNVKVTHYCICAKCCGKSDGITASGKQAVPYVTVAVDPKVIPLGADVLVDYGNGDIQYYKVEDTGGSIKGNKIDICVGSHEEAIQLGVKNATIWWVKQ